MNEKRFVAEQVDVVNEDETEVWDVVFDTENTYAFMVRDTDTASDLCDLLNEQDKEIGLLRLELDTHKHPLWSTREAERKLIEVTNNLADEVKKNGLLNEEINQLRIENMRLKKKDGDGV